MQGGTKHTPSLNGWLGGVAAGIVAFGVAMVLFDFEFSAAAFCAGVLTLIVGAILGLPPAPLPSAWTVQPVARPAAAERVAAPAPAPAPAPAAAPVAAAPAVSVASVAPIEQPAPVRPVALAAAREGGPDDLKRIKGIGPKLEMMCNSLGFYHYDQIAAWTDAELGWVDENLEGFKGRATRDAWVEQAKVLAAGGETEFSARADKA